MRRVLSTSITLILSGMLSVVFGAGAVQAQSGSLEPPSTAVDTNGDPVPSTQTQPSWDQTLPVSERFKLVMGGSAVLDAETGLVWQKAPSPLTLELDTALFYCLTSVTGDRGGWRLPSIEELSSLLTNLPAGHPFEGVDAGFLYWSATKKFENNNLAWVWSDGFNGPALAAPTGDNPSFWCVRGGNGGVNQY